MGKNLQPKPPENLEVLQTAPEAVTEISPETQKPRKKAKRDDAKPTDKVDPVQIPEAVKPVKVSKMPTGCIREDF